jgi:hypothetical protein
MKREEPSEGSRGEEKENPSKVRIFLQSKHEGKLNSTSN